MLGRLVDFGSNQEKIRVEMANITERIGVSYCSLKAAKTEWMFREQPIDDIGIDAHMERTDKSGKVQQLLALQIKSGESYFKENKEDYVFFAI